MAGAVVIVAGGCLSAPWRLIGGTMRFVRCRFVLVGALCAASVAIIGATIADATTPPEDTSTGTSESSPPSSGSAVTEMSDATAPDGGGVEILPPDELWAGATRGEWDARWWQWAVSMPEEVNPGFDVTGERCGYGQFGPVFFVPAAFTGEPAEPGFTVSSPRAQRSMWA